jgi:hypothetical protein
MTRPAKAASSLLLSFLFFSFLFFLIFSEPPFVFSWRMAHLDANQVPFFLFGLLLLLKDGDRRAAQQLEYHRYL